MNILKNVNFERKDTQKRPIENRNDTLHSRSIIYTLIQNNAKDLSDAEIDRSFDLTRGPGMRDYAKQLRDGGLIKESDLIDLKPKKFESKTQKGLNFWAEQESGGCWVIMSQMDGFPAGEAFDDWPANKSDAEQIAQDLADGKL